MDKLITWIVTSKLTAWIPDWVHRHPRVKQRITTLFQKFDTFCKKCDAYEAENPYAESPYTGTVCMLTSATIPCWVMAVVATIVALIVGHHPWNWVAGAFIAAAVFYTFAAVIVWSEDCTTLKKNGWKF